MDTDLCSDIFINPWEQRISCFSSCKLLFSMLIWQGSYVAIYTENSQYYNLKGGIHSHTAYTKKVWLVVKYNCQLLVKGRRNISSTLWAWTYFPRAKHSSFTVEPLATWTNSGNWTSIFGSYSPITPERKMQKNVSNTEQEGMLPVLSQNTHKKKQQQHNTVPLDIQHNGECWGKYFENSWKVGAFSSRWVSSCCSDNSYEPEK